MTLTLIKCPIKTQYSFLNIYDFSNDIELISNCISECDTFLHKSLDRQVGFFSDSYSGDYMYGTDYKVTTSKKLTPSLLILLDKINDLFNSDYNGILVNKYEDGSKYIAKHSDSKNHPENGVLIISYGATRNFGVYNKFNDKIVDIIPLISGQMIHMGGKFQEEFTHDVLADKKVKEVRYSLSFHKYMNLGLYEKQKRQFSLNNHI